ncbi:hypothetical protein A2642_04975 [Candidatus Nomurabacteria bacterium RIFCSPHIGHO2_01_FULL_39_10]|uniref:Methyltransferase type 11 domain-containing protein n=1 Tax=Candidatus Nomurabacteria bacterium RIFCSPHIGHO2_01_FULL_39_10 TaxID=1801733 RepID=A0A1F6V8Q5_9BACT|nr:MAG: hypothetical protein A2642_04975 [Candidatus Nomurabacteria bacterium RIFCSPHIGHO2_01_FULL_39_10]
MFHGNFKTNNLNNKRILEIGGAEPENIQQYSIKVLGAEYLNQTLDQECRDMPNTSIGSFMTLEPNSPYDLIFSNGVFEYCAINDDNPHGRKQIDPKDFEVQERKKQLSKLEQLLSKGGLLLINTISDPCIYSTQEIEQAGLRVIYRQRQDIYSPRSPSPRNELVIIEK